MDFDIISPIEFEQLCTDILRSVLGDEARFFKEGPDGGIDISARRETAFIMGQCKRYRKDAISALMNELKKEVIKVKNNNPSRYFVFTSVDLSATQVKDIYDMFSPYIKSDSDIFDSKKIEDYLKEEKSLPILRKNIKLYINSLSVLNEVLFGSLRVDYNSLYSKIQDNKCKYVETVFFKETWDKLHNKKIVLVTGNPGVGKTTTCEMVILKFLSYHPNAHIIYSSENNYETIKNSLSEDDSFELIYIDDFLGKTYIDINLRSIPSLISLFSQISRKHNKYLIINSRISVINEAKQKDEDFMNEYSKLECEWINIKELSFFDKAQILYSHIVASQLEYDMVNELIKDDFYLTIINHKNFNPRIINHITNINLIPNEVSCDKFKDYVAYKLNHPEQIWNSEYNNLPKEDRVLLMTLYSLTSYSVDINDLEKAFNEQKTNKLFPGIDLTQYDLFKQSYQRLSNCFIKSVYEEGKQLVSMADPSLNDCIDKYFKTMSVNEREEFLRHSVYIDQLFRINDGIIAISFIIDNYSSLNCRFNYINDYLMFEYVLIIASNYLDDSDVFKSLLKSIITKYMYP